MYNNRKSNTINIIVCLSISIILVCIIVHTPVPSNNCFKPVKECLVLSSHVTVTKHDWVLIKETLQDLHLEKCSDDYARYKRITDWVMSITDYDHTYTHNTAHSAIEYGLTCCHGYADLVHILCTLAKIPNQEVWGYTTEGDYHAWVQVYLDGVWYYSDISTYDELLKQPRVCELTYGQPYLSTNLFTYIDTITKIKG